MASGSGTDGISVVAGHNDTVNSVPTDTHKSATYHDTSLTVSTVCVLGGYHSMPAERSGCAVYMPLALRTLNITPDSGPKAIGFARLVALAAYSMQVTYTNVLPSAYCDAACLEEARGDDQTHNSKIETAAEWASFAE